MTNRVSGGQSRWTLICLPGAGLRTRKVCVSLIPFAEALQTLAYAPSAPFYDPEHGHLWITSSIIHGYCFKPLDPIQSLTLDSISFAFFDSNPPQISLRNLIPTVRNLHILYPITSPDSLLRFLSAFTALQDITVHAPRWIKTSDHDHDVEDLMLFCRTLRISGFDNRSSPFLSLLGSTLRGCEKVAIIKCKFGNVHPLQTLISHAGKTIRRLQIVVPLHGEHYLYTSVRS